MKIRLHIFKDRVTPKDADNMRTIEKSESSNVPLIGYGACIMNDDENNLRLMVICENGDVAVDIALDAHDASTIVSLIDDGSEMMADIVSSQLDEMESSEVQEIKDVVGGFIMSDFGSNKPAES